MTQDEYNELKAQVDSVAQGDVHLGRVLTSMLLHLGNLAGVVLLPPTEAGAAPPAPGNPAEPSTP